MNARLIQMMTKKGFVALFWNDLKAMQKTNPKVTHEEVYEKMETEYQAEFKQRRYANFKSFRTRRDERYRYAK